MLEPVEHSLETPSRAYSAEVENRLLPGSHGPQFDSSQVPLERRGGEGDSNSRNSRFVGNSQEGTRCPIPPHLKASADSALVVREMAVSQADLALLSFVPDGCIICVRSSNELE